MKKIAIVVLAFAFALGCKSDDKKKKTDDTKQVKPDPKPDPKPADKGYTLITPDARQWGPLDPKQPDGIKIAVVDGNPQEGPSAMFFTLPAGTDAGVHTHTVGYHAVVLSGSQLHWLPGEKDAKPLAPGGYWYQPGGQPHGDKCASKEDCVMFIIFEGKFDFAPSEEKKVDPGDAYTLVHAEDLKFGPLDPKQEEGLQVAVALGEMKPGNPTAFVIQVPPGAGPPPHHHTSDYYAVTFAGGSAHWGEGEPEGKATPAGTYWHQSGGRVHSDKCVGEGTCQAFVYMPKGFDFIPQGAPPAK